MAKFDVYRMAAGNGYYLDCQSDLLSELNTRLVAPLLAEEEAPRMALRLNPKFEIEGASFVMTTQFMGSVPLTELRVRVTSLHEHDLTIGNALDMLISGY
ncbi:CcdB-like toxin protein [Novosphingobium resinovorum]|jgi:toxin CcdB|uniref:Toxin CcdB n=1 Tax=Novosphingobium resinovorum TaxID=158500 RepID=A0A031JD74_9SPHN|nr:CcdB family protein [Novosphingobium resinovorum]EZP71178.1 CcdB-like toxin protein [Novosphingobium resinovorum]